MKDMTPTEHAEVNAALKAACAELDAERLEKIDDMDSLYEIVNLCKKDDPFVSLYNTYYFVARTLAQQMAERL